jgi:hypothetical protein
MSTATPVGVTLGAGPAPVMLSFWPLFTLASAEASDPGETMAAPARAGAGPRLPSRFVSRPVIVNELPLMPITEPGFRK